MADKVKLRNFKRHDTVIGVNAEQLLTPEETAALLKISPQTLAYWRRASVASDLPWIEVGGQVRYRFSDLQTWLDAHRKNGSAAL